MKTIYLISIIKKIEERKQFLVGKFFTLSINITEEKKKKK